MNPFARLFVRNVSLLVLVLFSAACGSSEEGSSGAAAAPKELNVLIYSEYIDPEIVEEFEKANGLEVRLDLYEAAEEMIAKLQHAGGVSQYDVVVAPDHAISTLINQKLLAPLDLAKLPNRAALEAQFLDPPFDPGAAHSAAYQWGTVGIMHRKDRLSNPVPTWALIFEPGRQPGPFLLIDSMRDMLSPALAFGGHSINSRDPAELKAAADLVLAAKQNEKCLGFEGGVGGKNKVAAGEAAMAIVYNGDALRAIDEDANLGFFVPAEGSIIWVDCMTIPAKAPNSAGAHAFINFILDPQIGARLSNFNRYATPNAKSLELIPEADRANPVIYPPEPIRKKLEFIEDVGEDTRLYDEVWTTIKSR